jgi:hypothetical protein
MADDLRTDLPAGMTLLEVVEGVRVKTWVGLKDVMSRYVSSSYLLRQDA